MAEASPRSRRVSDLGDPEGNRLEGETLFRRVYKCIHMGTEYRSVRLTAEAYDALERRKREDETFSEAVERLARERPIADLAGSISDGDVAAIREAREKSYERYVGRRRRE